MNIGDSVIYIGNTVRCAGQECIITHMAPSDRHGTYVHTDLVVPIPNQHGGHLTGIGAPIDMFELIIPTKGKQHSWEV
ncbi:MAG: hypothetical protein ACW99G_05035 [Candidatus Thorarchaeota archaeon]|jgi:hypothetical protein